MGLRVFKTALRNNQKYRKKTYIGDEFLFLFDRHCQYLNKIMSGIRLLEHVLYMNVSSHHSLILAKFGIRSLKISLKYFQKLCWVLILIPDMCHFRVRDHKHIFLPIEHLHAQRTFFVGYIVFHMHKTSKNESSKFWFISS